MGKCKSLGSLKPFLSCASQLSCGQNPVFFTSRVPLGLNTRSGCNLMAVRSQVFFSFLSALRLTSSHWTTGITDDCDILVYWDGRKYPTSHYAFRVELRGWKYLRKRKPCLHLIFFHWNTLCYTENLNELWGFYANNQVTDHSIQFFKNSCNTMEVKVKVKSLSRVQLFADTRLLRPWNFLGKSTGAGCHFFLQGIFLTQGSNPGLPHCRQTHFTIWATRVAP